MNALSTDIFCKINKDGSKKSLAELVEEKYRVQVGDAFDIDFISIFKLPDYQEVLKSIFKLGIDINLQLICEKNRYYSLLALAIAEKNINVSLFLIENGADINALDDFGFPVLSYAIGAKFTEGINLLIKHGAKFDELDADGINKTLLTSIFDENEIAVKILLKHGLDVTNQIQALTFAIYQLKKPIIEILINAGININSKDKDGNTPLAMAVLMLKDTNHFSKSEFEEHNGTVRVIMELLLIKGANPNVTFVNGRSILLQAELLDEQAYGLLVNYGADDCTLW